MGVWFHHTHVLARWRRKTELTYASNRRDWQRLCSVSVATTLTLTLLISAGFPPVEAVKAAPAAATEAEKKQSAAAALGESMREVVGSWRTWLLAVTYFFVYLIRQVWGVWWGSV